MLNQTLLQEKLKQNVPALRAGQVVRVHERIKEGKDKERIQVFEGLIIAVKHGKGLDGTFTVRKMGANNIGVERIFPLHMPAIEKIEILRSEKVRRAKLYYVRRQLGKKTKKRKTKLQNLIFDMGYNEEESQDIEESNQPNGENGEAVEAPKKDSDKIEKITKETQGEKKEDSIEAEAREAVKNKKEGEEK